MSDIVKEASAAALNIINTGEHFWRKGRTGAERGQGGPAGRAGACRLASVFSEEDWRGGPA